MKEIYVYLITLGIVISVATGWHYWDRHKAITQAISNVELKYKEKLIQKQNEARATQDQLIRDNIQAIKEKDEQIQIINVDLASALDKLRTRNSRPINYSTITRVEATCAGTELFREDAEFLTREAARADEIVVERNYYYERYEDARKQLKQLSEQK